MLKSDQPKISRSKRAKGLGRWNEGEDKYSNNTKSYNNFVYKTVSVKRMLKKWNKIFKDQFKNFPDVWMLTVSKECPHSNEWENSLEERLSMACKCKVNNF